MQDEALRCPHCGQKYSAAQARRAAEKYPLRPDWNQSLSLWQILFLLAVAAVGFWTAVHFGILRLM